MRVNLRDKLEVSPEHCQIWPKITFKVSYSEKWCWYYLKSWSYYTRFCMYSFSYVYAYVPICSLYILLQVKIHVVNDWVKLQIRCITTRNFPCLFLVLPFLTPSSNLSNLFFLILSFPDCSINGTYKSHFALSFAHRISVLQPSTLLPVCCHVFSLYLFIYPSIHPPTHPLTHSLHVPQFI